MNFLRRLQDIIFPQRCTSCRGSAAGSTLPYFCDDCWSGFSPLRDPVCPSCGVPFESPEALTGSSGHECSRCRREPPHFDQALAAGLFEGPLRDAIHLFKYRPVQSIGKPLSAWMAERVRMVHPLDIIMPIPLHRRRLRRRGFNQAVLLGHGVAERFGLPLDCDSLVRVRDTLPQVDLSEKERRNNVKDAFSVRNPGYVEGKRVLLIDDVLTTGATMNECSRVLKAAGATAVLAFTLARTGE